MSKSLHYNIVARKLHDTLLLKFDRRKVKECEGSILVSPTISRTDAPRERINPIAIRGFAWFPTSHPEEQRKKGGSIWRRSKDERRSIPGGGVSALGVLSKDIYADEVTSTISHCLDLPQHCGVFCTYGSVGWVCTRHHFIPLRHDDRLFVCWPDSASSCASVAQIGSFFGSKPECSPRELSSVSHFSYLMHLCAYLNVAPITRTNDPTKVPNLYAQCTRGIEQGTIAMC